MARFNTKEANKLYEPVSYLALEIQRYERVVNKITDHDFYEIKEAVENSLKGAVESFEVSVESYKSKIKKLKTELIFRASFLAEYLEQHTVSADAKIQIYTPSDAPFRIILSSDHLNNYNGMNFEKLIEIAAPIKGDIEDLVWAINSKRLGKFNLAQFHYKQLWAPTAISNDEIRFVEDGDRQNAFLSKEEFSEAVNILQYIEANSCIELDWTKEVV